MRLVASGATVLSLLTGLASAQNPVEFPLSPARSVFQWVGSTDQGQLVPTSSQAFILLGTIGLEVIVGPQGVNQARFSGGDALITPNIDALFAGGPEHPFTIKSAHIGFSSPTFAVNSNGSFSTTISPEFLEGTMTFDPPTGVPSMEPLMGQLLQPAMIMGQLLDTGSGYRLEMSPTLVFDIAAGGVSGSLTMTGDVVAELDCPDPVDYCTSLPNSVGAGSTISALGSTSVSANALLLQGVGLPPSQTGLFFYGSTQVQVPFGNGILCVGAPQYRLDIQQISLGGSVALQLDVASTGPAPMTIEAGSTWNFQFWYRDPAAGGAFFNLSQGLEIFFCP